MKITVFGSGYVGLVTAACFAELGHAVCCIDIDNDKIRTLQQGHVPLYEPGLNDLVSQNQRLGLLRFTTDAKLGIEHGEIIFIAVNTPSSANGAADLSQVLAVAETIGQLIDHQAIIVDKSTVPVGTADQVSQCIQQHLAKRNKSLLIPILSNPEFLREGSALNDFLQADRVIIGSKDQQAAIRLQQLYEPCVQSLDHILIMDVKTAEFAKYAANAMLACRISFMNEMALLADCMGVDIKQIQRTLSTDPRIGHLYLNAGCGYGGACFPKDVAALNHMAKSYEADAVMLKAIAERNQRQRHVIFEKVRNYFNHDLQSRTIALWGLSFKPNTNDMREAPSRTLIADLIEAGASIQAYDPVARKEAHELFGGQSKFRVVEDPYLALANADCLVIVTEWDEFLTADWQKVITYLKSPVVFDGRNGLNPEILNQHGLHYLGIGRQSIINEKIAVTNAEIEDLSRNPSCGEQREII